MKDPRAQLIEVGRGFYERGWMWATAGNVSARADRDSFWITMSGVSKGHLSREQFVRVAVADGSVRERDDPEARPSAETAIHRAVYAARPDVQACLHGHSIEAVLASRDRARLPLPEGEMIKALTPRAESPAVLPVFRNHHDVALIAREVAAFLGDNPDALPAIVVADHGTTAWGRDIAQALQHFEAVEFLLRLLVRAGGVGT